MRKFLLLTMTVLLVAPAAWGQNHGTISGTVLAEGFYQAGPHDIIWDGCDSSGKPAASGIYYYRLKAGDCSETNRMTLLK